MRKEGNGEESHEAGSRHHLPETERDISLSLSDQRLTQVDQPENQESGRSEAESQRAASGSESDQHGSRFGTCCSRAQSD